MLNYTRSKSCEMVKMNNKRNNGKNKKIKYKKVENAKIEKKGGVKIQKNHHMLKKKKSRVRIATVKKLIIGTFILIIFY